MNSTQRSNIDLQRLRHVALSIGQIADTVSRRSMSMSTEDIRILSALHDHPESTATEIAKLTLLTPVQVGRRVSRLKKVGHIVAKADCMDGRAIRLSLSPQGLQAWARTKLITQTIQAWAIRDITDAEWDEFSRTLNKLLASLNASEQENHVQMLIKKVSLI